jgi:hypothetical protein
MDWIGWLLSLVFWILPRDRLFGGLPLWKHDRDIKAKAKKDPRKACDYAFNLLSEELRLAVRRATIENPSGPVYDPQILRRANLIDSETEDAIRRLHTTKYCVSERDAIEYWLKVKSVLKRIKKIPGTLPA